MQFAHIPEHDACKSALIRSVSIDKIAHAQLFIGPIGSANLALALAFATFLNCMSRKQDDACGNCLSCVNMAQYTHPDFQFIFPGRSNDTAAVAQTSAKDTEIFRDFLKLSPYITLEAWHSIIAHNSKQSQITRTEVNKIIQRISLKSFLGRYKIVLIWLPEHFTNAAANALLKTLEEPPAHTVFLLVSSNNEKILPTIRSRSQQHNILPFSDQAIEQILQDHYSDLHIHQLKKISFLAEGNIIKAFKQVEIPAIDDNFEWFSNWMRNCYSGDYAKLIHQAESFHALSAHAQKNFFTYALQLIRIALLSKFNTVLLQTTIPAEAAFSKKFGVTLHTDQLATIIAQLSQSYYYIERNANAKMVYANLSIQIAQAFQRIKKGTDAK